MSYGNGNMLSPPGWINPTTPGSATVLCGNITQTGTYPVDGDSPLQIPFDAPASWSDKLSWTSDEVGAVWTCVQGGIYFLQASQELTINNAANIVNPIVNVYISVVSNTTTEFNRTLQTTLLCPATTTDSQVVTVSVSGYVNVDAGTSMSVNIEVPAGDISVISGPVGLPSPGGILSWNLVALGAYGNVGNLI